MPVTGSTSLPIAPRNTHWHGSDARARVVDHFTTDGKTNWGQVKRAFFWVEPGKEELKTGYNLGFADIVGGKLQIVDRGVFAVAGGHGVTRIQGVSSGDKAKIKRKVNALYRKMKAKWPNDDFDFEPPFPEVKSMEEIQSDIEAKTQAFVEKYYHYHTMGATSFAELESVEIIRQTIQKVFQTVHNFEALANTIANRADSPNEMISGLKKLTDEMSVIFDRMEIDGNSDNDKGLTRFINDYDFLGNYKNRTEGVKYEWDIKQFGNTALLKAEDGQIYFYGRFTNNIKDKEDETLTTEAHVDFVKYLDENPEEAPELWDWHEKETAKTHRAVWWDYSDGFLHTIWPVTPEEAQGIGAFAKEFEPGMSHGFKVLERSDEDPLHIVGYRTFEASILPLEFAANEYTTFELLKEKEEKMLSPEKERALDLLSLGKYKKPLGKASEQDAEALDQAGVQRKEQDTMENSDPKEVLKSETSVPNKKTSKAPETTPPASDTIKMIEALQASIVDGFQLLDERIKGLTEMVESHDEALKGIKEAKGQSPSVAAWVASQRAETSIGDQPTKPKASDSGEVEKDDPLFGAGPAEAAFEFGDGHLLQGL